MTEHARTFRQPPTGRGRSARLAPPALSRPNARAERLAEFGDRYERQPGDVCVYCGERANGGGDHVPPLHMAGKVKGFPFRIWPACSRCNLAIGAFGKTCLRARARRSMHVQIEALEKDAVARVRFEFGSTAPAALLSARERRRIACSVHGIIQRLNRGSLIDACPCRYCAELGFAALPQGAVPAPVPEGMPEGFFPPLPEEPEDQWVPSYRGGRGDE